jgi:hypothetical protein
VKGRFSQRDKKPTDRKLLAFGLTFGVLVLQFGIGQVASEPYPSVMYPSFAAIHNTEGVIEFPTTDVLITMLDGSVRQMSTETLLSDIPQSFLPSVLESIDRQMSDAEARVWSSGDLDADRRLEGTQSSSRREFTAWLAAKARERVGFGAATVSLRMFNTRVFLEDDPIREESTLDHIVVIHLAPAE